jgi:two-component system cell cycle sensor histidine kinase/response regulator CckA
MPDNGPRTSNDSLADLSPVPLFLVQDRVVRYANQAFCELCGAPASEVVGRAIVELVHSHDRGHVLERLDEHQRGRPDTHRAQFRLRQPSGHDVWVFATLVPRSLGSRPATLGTALDVRERRHAQESVAKAQRLDAVARLAGGIAHDFNNALQIILGHAERVVGALPETHQAHASAVEIRRAAMRAAHLTDRLLSFGQRQLLDPQPLDLSRLILDLKVSIERRVGPSINVVLRRGKWTAPVRVDRLRLVHVLAALVDNAREAMAQGGQLVVATDIVTIDAAARTERPWLRLGEYVRVAVEDSGPGLNAEATVHAFEPFYTTKASGDGLGLPAVYGLVKQSHGFVWIEGAPGGGTRVVVLLPADGPATATSSDAAPSPVLRAVPPPHARPHVLVVEDENSVRELMASALERNGFDVTAVGSAEEAVGFAPGTYDVLLSDISLPGMNGVELAKRILRAAPDAKVLLMSGYAREEYLTPADDLPFIGKPFTTRAIIDRLRSLLAEPPAASSESRPA